MAEKEVGKDANQLTELVSTRENPTQWLTLKDASTFLGIHYTTLRSWADKGEIPVFRTPGGHRRFSLADLRRFLNERVNHGTVIDESALIDAAVGRVRKEIRQLDDRQSGWQYELDEDARQQQRSRGRRLFALAISYVLKPSQQAQILENARILGWEYGQEAAASNISVVETGRAVQFFRSQLVEAVYTEDHPELIDADTMRIQRLIDQFLDEVLYAVLDGYEQMLQIEQKSS